MERYCVTMLALGAVLIGMVLGIRFRFVILLPVILVGSAIVAAIALYEGESAGHALLGMIAFSCLLQLGYVCTALIAASIFRSEHEEAQKPEPRPARSIWQRARAARHGMNPF
jgi:hypothetical protein